MKDYFAVYGGGEITPSSPSNSFEGEPTLIVECEGATILRIDVRRMDNFREAMDSLKDTSWNRCLPPALENSAERFGAQMRRAIEAGAHHLRLSNGSHCAIDLGGRCVSSTDAQHDGVRAGWWNRDGTAVPSAQEILVLQETMEMLVGDEWAPVPVEECYLS